MDVSDLQLIDNIKKHKDNNSFIELSRRHTPLCYSMYNRFSQPIAASGMSLEDVKDDKDLIVYKSALSFDPSKNVKFSTWLANNVRFQCLNFISSDSRYLNMESDDITKIIDKNQTNTQPSSFDSDYVFSILDQLKDKRVSKVFKLKYFSDADKVSWRSIAEIMKTSIQTAINLHKRGLKILSQKIDSKTLFDEI